MNNGIFYYVGLYKIARNIQQIYNNIVGISDSNVTKEKALRAGATIAHMGAAYSAKLFCFGGNDTSQSATDNIDCNSCNVSGYYFSKPALLLSSVTLGNVGGILSILADSEKLKQEKENFNPKEKKLLIRSH